MAVSRLAHFAQGRHVARAVVAARRLRGDEGGASAIEFAFIAPMLVLLIGGILDVAMILFVNSALEGGIRDASRFGITGFTPAAISRETQIVEFTNRIIEHRECRRSTERAW